MCIRDSFNGSGLFGEGNRLFEKPGGDMLPACLAGAFPTLQVRIFFHHIGVKIVLPLCQIRPVADDFFRAQAVVLCQRNKGQMQVGRFLVHVGLPPVQGHQHLYAGAQQAAEGQIRMGDLTGKTGRCPNKREKREPKDQP